MKPLLIALALAGCASTQLELPDDHPANASAPTLPVTSSRVLRADYDPFANGTEPATNPEPQHQHHHHGKGSEK